MGEKKKQASAYREPLILIAFVILGAIIGMVMGEKASFLYPIGQIWSPILEAAACAVASPAPN